MSDQQTPRRAPLRRQWPAVTWLTVVWVLFWGDLSLGNVVAGVAVAVAVLLVFPQPALPLRIRPHPAALVRLVVVFVMDLVVSSLQVAGNALRLGAQPRNAVILVPLRTRSDFSLMLTAELLSLVPGSLLVDASNTRWAVQLHIMDTPDLEAVQLAREHVWAQERRVVEALGEPNDVARVRRPPPPVPVGGGTSEEPG